MNKVDTISHILRYNADDDFGWVSTQKLSQMLSEKFKDVDFQNIVEENGDLFSFSSNKEFIKLNREHQTTYSTLTETEPPEILFYGTSDHQKILNKIIFRGLEKNDQHVQLSETKESAMEISKRRGSKFVIYVKAKMMYESGHKFYRTENGIWLTDHVPPDFIY